MTDEISFFFDENDELCCRVSTRLNFDIYKSDKAIDYLCHIDSIEYDHMSATARTITLSNDDITVIIEDIAKFFQGNYTSHLINTLNSINETIADYQKKKHKRHVVTNLKVQGSRVVAGGLVLALLGSAHSIIKKQFNNDERNGSRFDKEQVLDLENTEDNNLNIMTQDIDTLLDELDNDETNQELDSLTSNDSSIPEYPINAPYLNIENDESDILEFNDEVIQDEPISVAYLDIQDKTGSEKYEHAYNNYHNTVEQYSNRWGNSTNVMMAILTQETGGYIPEDIMQIVFQSWEGQRLSAYNFENGCYEKFVLDNDKEKYAGENITVYTKEDLKNPEISICMACIIFRFCFKEMEYNIPATIQSYNQGTGGLKRVFATTSEQTGLSVDELLSDQTNLEFMNYTNTLSWGDPEYLYHVTWYLDTSEDITFKVIDENGEISEISTSFVRGSKSL